VLLASYVLNSVAVKHHLSDIARFYLDLDPTDLESLVGKGRNKLTLAAVKMADFSDYACQKADIINRLALSLEQDMSAEGHLAGLYRYYEVPLIEVLQQVERNGIRLDAEVLNTQSKQLSKQLDKLQAAVFEIADEEFNLASPKQLQSIFYEKLELPILKKTKTGQPSTAEPVLQELAQDYELPRLILEHRSLNKLKSTYTDKLPLEVNADTGRIHSSFQQAVAATGRLSSTDPNLQNIPIRTAEGRRVRQAFVASKGNKLLAADYSQVELRIMAHLSQDAGLLSAFSSDQDVHRATAADVFNTSLDDVTPEQRRSAKAINFGLIYGMSAFGLANQLNVSRGEAQEYVDRYFHKYPGVRDYMEQTQALADEKGYVETIFGRRLYLPDIHAGNAMIRKAAQRTAINAPMKGSAADIIKQAMIDIANWLEQDPIDARMVLQVHDELVFDVKEEDVDLLSAGVKFRMATAASLDVPLIVDVGVGDNWDQAH
jgi:DNA polymerase-1